VKLIKNFEGNYVQQLQLTSWEFVQKAYRWVLCVPCGHRGACLPGAPRPQLHVPYKRAPHLPLLHPPTPTHPTNQPTNQPTHGAPTQHVLACSQNKPLATPATSMLPQYCTGARCSRAGGPGQAAKSQRQGHLHGRHTAWVPCTSHISEGAAGGCDVGPARTRASARGKAGTQVRDPS
jgi:hypothetical protein